MQLVIDGQPCQFIDIQEFRAQHQLPPEFGLNLFEPKDSADLGTLNEGGTALNELRDALLQALPQRTTLPELLGFIGRLSNLFRVKMMEINETIGLKQVEIDFAAAGFEDVCQTWFYAIMRGQPDFQVTYTQWLNDSARLSSTMHPYIHGQAAWTIQVVNTIYGRVGLAVDTGSALFYVRDYSMSCPAEAFMLKLLLTITARLQAALPAAR